MAIPCHVAPCPTDAGGWRGAKEGMPLIGQFEA